MQQYVSVRWDFIIKFLRPSDFTLSGVISSLNFVQRITGIPKQNEHELPSFLVACASNRLTALSGQHFLSKDTDSFLNIHKKNLPFSAALCAVIVPPHLFTIPCTTESPMPVASPCFSVAKRWVYRVQVSVPPVTQKVYFK